MPVATPSTVLKTYRATTMADALAEVKRDLGKDAVILHTRSYKVGGIMGVGARPIVEITASSGVPTERRGMHVATRNFAAVARRGARPTEVLDTSGPVREPVFVTPPWSAGPGASPADRRVVLPPPEASPVAPVLVRPGTAPSATPPTFPLRVPLAPVDPPARLLVEDELASIKKLVAQVLAASRQAASQNAGRPAPASAAVLNLGPMTDPLFANYMRLGESHVGPDIAEDLAGAVLADLPDAQRQDAAVVRAALLRRMAAQIPTATTTLPSHLRNPQAEAMGVRSRPLTIALVGPTGVGKTTTIAKLAALYKLRHGCRVGLVTSDTYRIAAVEQLRTYAGILQIPLRVVMTPDDLAAACSDFGACEVVLVDTAGRSQHDSVRIEQLAEFVRAAAPHETHLTLAMTVAEPVLMKTVERFSALNADRVILTKLDEAVHFGPILNLHRRTGLKLSYVTTGQEVPDQIELADAPKLARVVLDGEWA